MFSGLPGPKLSYVGFDISNKNCHVDTVVISHGDRLTKRVKRVWFVVMGKIRILQFYFS